MKRVQSGILLITAFSCASAVNINPGGYGEAIMLPYYTVNNNLNTVLTINNSTEMTKAIKVHFREGKAGNAVLTFNLYLAPNDMWAAGLVPTTSSIAGHVGEDSGSLVFNDQSCTPFLLSGQQLLPYEFEAGSGDTDLSRAKEGYIEVIEMGELDPSFGLGLAATFNNPGSAVDCSQIQDALSSGGIWDEANGGNLNAQLMPAEGGLSASSSLIDVSEGLMYSIDGVAFENFYPDDSALHTEPGDTDVPSLEYADTTSVMIEDGDAVSTTWQHGYQAISALLMKNHLEGFYDISPFTASSTEVVISMPTKRFYEADDSTIEQPFEQEGSGEYDVCATFDVGVLDRETSTNICSNEIGGVGCSAKNGEVKPYLTPIPPGVDNDRYLCHAINVIQLVSENESVGNQPTKILGSQVYNDRDVVGFESGKMLLAFDQVTAAPGGDDYHGMPVLAYSLIKYINGNAAPGVLAQYGGINQLNYKVEID